MELNLENIEPKLDNLFNIEEELKSSYEELENLETANKSMQLAKEILGRAYEKMKRNVSPKFTEELSLNISQITEGKYKHLIFNDEEGLKIELENGNYIQADRLSIGTIDQLYLSLRLAMVDEISTEKIPIILDEAFAYFDNNRLKNILKYLSEKYKNRQIIIFTCTKREKEIFKELNININFIEL